MKSKKTLTIKDWYGAGKGSLNIEIMDFTIERLSNANGVFDKLTIRRKPDGYSSRIGVMAYLNKSAGKLRWGFPAMTLKVDEYSKNGVAVTQREFNFHGGAVENSSAEHGFEVITLVSNMIGQACFGNC
jgi:hypothetical protein